MITPLLCRVLSNSVGDIIFESAETKGLTLTQTIHDDEKYGTFKPANGKYFTYAILNDDDEFTEKQAHKAVRYAYKRWALYGKLPKLKRVGKAYNGIIDFRIEFRTVESDPDKKLTKNTIMYHYYPIHKVDHPLRGLCVVNKRFFFTPHGNPITGEFMRRHGVRTAVPGNMYRTIDFDLVYSHELGHGLGLPHDTEEGNVMSWRYDMMNEMPAIRDQSRIIAKYGKKIMSGFWLARWLRWLRVASDR